MKLEPSKLGDAWFEAEQPTRLAMIAELQRIRRRTLVRPLPVLALALAVTALITYKVATKPIVLQSEVVLALTEGELTSHRNNLPVDQLREYVSSVLLPDNRLLEVIEKHNLSRLRRKLGPQFAIEELRSKLEIQIWRNSFAYVDVEDRDTRRSARIALAVSGSDPDEALDIARDLAEVAIESAAAQRQKLADALSNQVSLLRDAINDQLDKLDREMSIRQAAIDDARKRGRTDIAGILGIQRAALFEERRRAEDQLGQIATSQDAFASDIAAAGLDMSLDIVEENRPERPTHRSFVLVLVTVVVGTGALLGAALLIGAFDSRVHDVDDVARLGLPVLGHVPGFAGDNVGSMQTRGAPRARVPSFHRWRSHR